jgi:hypothetical protein
MFMFTLPRSTPVLPGVILAAGLAILGCGTPRGAAAGPAPSPSPPAGSPCASPPPELAVPAGNALAFEALAEGVQIYACTAAAAGPAWTLKAPEAVLRDRAGAPVGTHSAGPTWAAADGSAVVGAKVAGATPDASAIPWLLVRATSHAGQGRMAQVTFVQRVGTVGGLAPAGGCDAAAAGAGAVTRVPYTATYCFYAPGAGR